jgi:hypothetical protein
MGSLGRLISRALRRWHRPRPGVPWQARVRRPTVVFVGIPETSVVLDDVLEPGSYDLLCISSSENAYAEILRAMPDRVVICLAADDERSLQLLAILSLDSRTRRLDIITCVASVNDGVDEPPDAGLARCLVPARKALVMH